MSGLPLLRDLAWEFVEIWKVDGHKRSSRRVTSALACSDYDQVRPMPGCHLAEGEFGQDVRLPIVVDDAQHFVATGSTRTLRLNVEPGCTYALTRTGAPSSTTFPGIE